MMRAWWIIVALVAVVVVVALGGCGEHRAGRASYNEGVEALGRGAYEDAIKALLEACNRAGVDPELRFRAAFDLGLAYAAQAEKVKGTELAKAVEHARNAFSWFGDAVKQRPKDAEAIKNREILRVRVQALSDELRKSEGKLEVRIDRAIADQRGVLDGARSAWLAIKQARGADPLAHQAALVGLADTERAIVAEVGAISDLASDEIDAIGKKPEEQRSDEEKVRAVQLRGLDLYLLEARARIAEARRKLQELATEDAIGRAEAAMIALKRAREQLLDPITVMRNTYADQVELARDTGLAGGSAGFTLGAAPAAAPVVPWLDPAALTARQDSVHDRLDEVRTRLAAAAAGPAPPEPEPAQPNTLTEAQPQPQPTPEQAQLIARVKVALPYVETAVGAMDEAKRALGDKQLAPALAKQDAALAALLRAIEEFADLKQTIELAYADQEKVTALISPEGEKLAAGAERGKQTGEAIARNLSRGTRLERMIADAVAQVAQQEQELAAKAAKAAPGAGSAAPAPAPTPPLAAGSGSGSGAPPAPPSPEEQAAAAKQALEGEKQKLARAEALRGEYLVALNALTKALAQNQDPTAPAAEARQKIGELRKLFFSVIEHLQQLIRDQGDTRDRTSELHTGDPIGREPKYPVLIEREQQHGAMANAITEALAAQADAAAKQPAGQGPQQGPDPKTLGKAADEVRQAQRAMGDAITGVAQVRDAKGQSVSLEPAIKAQGTAIEHLENALRLLQPPKQQQQQQNDQDQDQQQPQPQQAHGQAARDQDARQQKKRLPPSKDPVEKDW